MNDDHLSWDLNFAPYLKYYVHVKSYRDLGRLETTSCQFTGVLIGEQGYETCIS